ncbi:MAG: hypothetical protein KJ062_09340, partial [Thermoanaerobaculia bacterium]|nr:hypothetical protein [Thermoanaerobaculia bacterium]
MGEVWRGRAPRLDRDVAPKVLPERSATDAGSLDRFRAEALAAIIREEPPALGREGAAVPDDARRILARCLAKEPSGRYASTNDLARDLADSASRLPGDAPGSAGRPRGEDGRTPSRLRAPAAVRGMLVAAAVAASALVAWTFLRPGPAGIRSLAVLPFADRGTGAEARTLGDGVAESLI